MKYINTPILGDPVYGFPSINKSYHLDKQQLHAYSLEFIHPQTHEPLKLTTPLPCDMKLLIKKEFQDINSNTNKQLFEFFNKN